MEHDKAHGGGAVPAGEEEALEVEREELSDSESGSESIEISDLKRRMWKDQMLLSKLEGRAAATFRAGPSSRPLVPPPTAGAGGEEETPERCGAGARRCCARRTASSATCSRCDGGLQRARVRVRHHRRGRRPHVRLLRQPPRLVEGQRQLRPVGAHGAHGAHRREPAGGRVLPPPPPGHPGQHAGVRALGAHPALRAAAEELPAGPRAGAAVVAHGGGGLVGLPGRGTGAPGRAAVPEAARPQEGVEDQPAQRRDQAHEPALRPDAQARVAVQGSKRLQQKMSARETETWSKILRQEETLSRRLKSSLKITPLDADGDGDGDDEEEDGLEDVVHGVHDKRKRELISTGGNIGQSSSSRGGGELVAGLVADENDLICPIDELLKRYYSCVPDQHDSVVAPENEAGVMTMPLGELDLCGVVDDVPPDVLFDLIASCSGADDAFRLMED